MKNLYKKPMVLLLNVNLLFEESELLKEFLDRVNKHNKKITNKDEELFKDDPLLLTGISFKDIWNDKITHKTKELFGNTYKPFAYQH